MAALLMLAAAAAAAAAMLPVASAQENQLYPVTDTMRAQAQAILAMAAPSDGGIPNTPWERLAYLTDTFGPRFSGSASLEAALDWIAETAAGDGLVVTQEPTLVPKWVRGTEWARLLTPRLKNLHMVGLGMSPPTGNASVVAPAFVVASLPDLQANCSAANGTIVVWNVPFTTYGETVQYRANGGTWAAACGAVATLVRSVGPFSLQNPHTGGTSSPIPAAAITIEDAAQLARMQARGQAPVVELFMQSQWFPPSPSRNILIDIPGSEHPTDIVLVSGHADSWDVAEGAMDDGGGVIVSWEALRLIKAAGIVPKRTLRAVAWVNEENGSAGGKQYAADITANGTVGNHSIMLESDMGAFAPYGLGFSGHPAALLQLTVLGELLAPIGAGNVSAGGSGTDIGPSCALGIPCGEPLVLDPRLSAGDSNNPCAGYALPIPYPTDPASPPQDAYYFWIHHSQADTMERMDPRQLNYHAGALAVWLTAIAELPTLLPRSGSVPTPFPQPGNGSTLPTGAIVGGAVGGAALLLAIAGALLWRRRRGAGGAAMPSRYLRMPRGGASETDSRAGAERLLFAQPGGAAGGATAAGGTSLGSIGNL